MCLNGNGQSTADDQGNGAQGEAEVEETHLRMYTVTTMRMRRLRTFLKLILPTVSRKTQRVMPFQVRSSTNSLKKTAMKKRLILTNFKIIHT